MSSADVCGRNEGSQVRSQSTLSEEQRSVPNVHFGRVTTTCNYSFKGFGTLF